MRPLLFLLLFGTILATNFYRSKVRNSPTSIQLVKSSVLKKTDFKDGISICGRFMFDRLKPPQHIFCAQKVSWPDKPNRVWFTCLWNGDLGTFMAFGNYSALVKISTKDKFSLWTQSAWHSLCLSFNRQTNHLVIVKDDKITSVDTKLSRLRLDDFDGSFLDEFYPMDWSSSGRVSDINVWDFALTKIQMQDWTLCRY